MESESEVTMVPFLNLCKGGVMLEEGSEEWKEMSKKVIEAFENHGFCLLMCDEIIPKSVREELFNGMKTLFDLPEETKEQHQSPKPFRSYLGKSPGAPLLQSFGVDDVPYSSSALIFTKLMWPQGNPPFCEALEFMSVKMLQICALVLKLIVEGYGLSQHYLSDVETMKSSTNTRLMKYKTPETDSQLALPPHTDKGSLTILCPDEEAPGLQVLSKSGKWIPLKVPRGVFVVTVGDILQAWSNGRLHAVTHRVVMTNEDKVRYSFGLFIMPKDEDLIEVPDELVDQKTHPLRYRPFKYGEYMSYFSSKIKPGALEEFAGV